MTVNRCIVTLEISLLFESFFAYAAYILWRFATLVVQMTLEATLVSIRSSAPLTWKWITLMSVGAPVSSKWWWRIAVDEAIPWNVSRRRTRYHRQPISQFINEVDNFSNISTKPTHFYFPCSPALSLAIVFSMILQWRSRFFSSFAKNILLLENSFFLWALNFFRDLRKIRIIKHRFQRLKNTFYLTLLFEGRWFYFRNRWNSWNLRNIALELGRHAIFVCLLLYNSDM